MSERPRAVPTVRIDNERTRVTEWRFAPDAATGWHRHEHDYVIVPLASGRLRYEDASGTGEAELTAGLPYFREAGIEHDVVNANDYEFSFIEVELKAEAARRSGSPADRAASPG